MTEQMNTGEEADALRMTMEKAAEIRRGWARQIERLVPGATVWHADIACASCTITRGLDLLEHPDVPDYDGNVGVTAMNALLEMLTLLVEQAKYRMTPEAAAELQAKCDKLTETMLPLQGIAVFRQHERRKR